VPDFENRNQFDQSFLCKFYVKALMQMVHAALHAPRPCFRLDPPQLYLVRQRTMYTCVTIPHQLSRHRSSGFLIYNSHTRNPEFRNPGSIYIVQDFPEYDTR
jgi:hypothetical protein